jgi:hypothetical protein
MMNVEDYEYNAKKIFDFQNEDQYNETNESWFGKYIHTTK